MHSIPFHLLLDIYTEIVDIYQAIIIDLWINIILKMLFLQLKGMYNLIIA